MEVIKDQIDILIVDDREDGLLALEVALASTRWNLVKASSGHEALEKLENHEFAAILLDVQMPGIDGFQTAALIRDKERHRHTPILFVTAINKDELYVYKGYELGAVDYIFKPFDPAILRSKVSVFADLFVKTKQLERQAEMIRESERRERYLRLAELEVESLKRYRSLADAIPHIVWKANGEGTLDYFNKGWTDYTGLTTEQSVGVGWQSALEPNDLRKILRYWLDAMSNGTAFETEARLKRDDGEYRWHLLKTVPEFRNGSAVAWIGTSTDIHDRRIMEIRLLEAQRQAEAASQAKTNFLANMSHEIRTPLNAIMGFAELLLTPGQSPEENLRSIATVRRSGRQLLRIIDDILDISKVEAGHLEVESIDVDIRQVLDDVHALLQLQAQDKGLLLDFHLKSPVPRLISSDPTRLKQILMNLVGNAIKFTSKGGISITVGWASSQNDQGTLEFEIHDTGPGIDPDEADKLFRPFVQVDNSMTRRFGGTGLGLALSKRLAQLMGGDVILAESTRGKGSTFLVRLSTRHVSDEKNFLTEIHRSEETEAVTAVALSEEHRLDGLNILVVDDSVDNQTLISRFLKSAGAKVELAANGQEAMDKALAGEYQVVLMDIQMPYVDGFEATSRLRGEGYTRPIIALTAHALKEEKEKCLEVGCTSHLTKPIEKKTLIEHVAEIASSSMH